VYKLVAWVETVLIPTLGPAGLFLVAAADSSFVTIPEINDFLVIGAGMANPHAAWMFVATAALGSVAGSSLLWRLGRTGGEALLVRRFGSAWAERTRAAYARWGLLALALPAILPPPMPFKVFVLASGVLGLPYLRFFLTLFLARSLRYAFWGSMGAIYGEEARALLQAVDKWGARHWTLVVTVLALAAVSVLLAVRRSRARDPVDAEMGGAS
jgi:membrane protein YqaA with SNARE-associated domain